MYHDPVRDLPAQPIEQPRDQTFRQYLLVGFIARREVGVLIVIGWVGPNNLTLRELVKQPPLDDQHKYNQHPAGAQAPKLSQQRRVDVRREQCWSGVRARARRYGSDRSFLSLAR